MRQEPAAGALSHLKQIAAGVLDVGYVDVGPPEGPAVVLLHGWPYDIHTYAEVSPRLAAAGHRVIVPYLRGYGPTRFLSEETPRNGQQAALAVDTIALMDALGIDSAILAGTDWGARTADIVAARGDRPYGSVDELWRRARVPPSALELLAEADAFQALGLERRAALWAIRGLRDAMLPLFAAADEAASALRPEFTEPDVSIDPMSAGRRVVQVIGDGGFHFSSPDSVYAVAQQYQIPILTVVLDNGGWQAVKSAVQRVYPKGVAAETDQFQSRLASGRQGEQRDFSAVARAFGAHGECVAEPDDLAAAIDRCLAALDDGKAAVLHVHITGL